MKPDLAGFRDAAVRMRAEMGTDVPFFIKTEGTWPPDAAIDPETGKPFDPTVGEIGSAMSSAVVRAGVYTAPLPGTREGRGEATPIGWFEEGNIVLDVDPGDYEAVRDAFKVSFAGEFYEIADVTGSQIDDVEHRKLIFARRLGRRA